MTDAEYAATRARIRLELAQPKRCGMCHVAYSLVPDGYCCFKQVPVWSPPEELPVGVCFVCSPPDWGGRSAATWAEAERLDKEDEKWNEWMRQIEAKAALAEADAYRNGEYTDDMSPADRRIR